MYEKLMSVGSRIEGVTLYLVNVDDMRKFSFGVWRNRQHVFAVVRTRNCAGYGENIISVNTPDIPLDEWKDHSSVFKGLTVGQAIRRLRTERDSWDCHYVEMLEMALIDLAGKELGCPAMSLFGFDDYAKVDGVFVILDDDPEHVRALAREAAGSGMSKIVKVKLFGDEGLDLAIVESVRSVLSRTDTLLIGDVNTGYGREGEAADIYAVSQTLRRLYDAGLDGCEDPAFLSVKQWTELQSMVDPLSLIPDYILRPSRRAIATVQSGMGKVFNIHPGSAGSVIDAIELARHIRAFGGELMVGDDSLIGPACTVWQQIAMVFRARWVEAVEKPRDSSFFRSCIVSINTDSLSNPVTYEPKTGGFGLILDEERLSAGCLSRAEV